MTRNRVGRGALLAALASGALLVSGCMTETPFKPATGTGFYRTGYSERQVEKDRWLVTFAGNTVTDRDTVERYLLFRSAQLTVENGYDTFIMVQRDTDRQARTYSTGAGIGPYGGWGGYWGPSWGFYGRGFGWRRFGGGFGWGGWGGYGFGDDFDVRTVDRYEASAEIVMRKGAPAASEVRAFNAREVIDKIGPSVVLPKAS